MNYELAKQLKDAGFGNFADNVIDGKTGKKFTDIWMPTLSELIEACGDKSVILWKVEKNHWQAGLYDYGSDIYVDSYPDPNERGKTPKEAVAKLWLKLNK